MTNLLSIAVSNVLFASALAVLALIVTRIWRSPHLAHALWALVLVKLLTPPLATIPVPESWVSAPQVSSVAPLEIHQPSAVEAGDGELSGTPSAGPLIQVINLTQPLPEATPRSETFVIPPAAGRPPFPWQGVLAAIWCVGSVGCAFIMLRRIVRFRRVLAGAEDPPADVSDAASRLASALGLRRCPRLSVVDAAIPPLVWSLGVRPVIVLPASLLRDLDASQRDSVIAHELAHIRRRDDLVRWLEFAALIVWWWNPITWLARRKLHEAEEACCDAWVVSVLPDERRSYGEALLKTIEFLSERPATAVPIGSAFGVSFYQRRVEMIMNRQVSRRMSVWAFAMVLLIAVIALPLGAQTSSQETPPTTQPPPTAQPARSAAADEPVSPVPAASAGTEEPAEAGATAPKSTQPQRAWPKPVDPAPPFCTVRGVILDREQMPISRQPVWIIGKRDKVTLLYSDGPTGEDGTYEFAEIPANVSWQVFVPYGNGPDGIATRGYSLQPDAAADVRIVLTGDYSFEYTVQTTERATASQNDAGAGSEPADPASSLPRLSVSQHADERELQERLLQLDIDAAEAAWEQAAADYERLQKLGNAVSASEVAKKRTEAHENRIRFERAQTMLELFRLQSQRVGQATTNIPQPAVQIATGSQETTIQLPKVQYEMLSFQRNSDADSPVSQWAGKEGNQDKFQDWLEDNVHLSPAQIGVWLNNHGAGVATVTMTGPVDLDAVRKKSQYAAERIVIGPWVVFFQGPEMILVRHVQQTAPEPTPTGTF